MSRATEPFVVILKWQLKCAPPPPQIFFESEDLGLNVWASLTCFLNIYSTSKSHLAVCFKYLTKTADNESNVFFFARSST